jgi:hypothetical protein
MYTVHRKKSFSIFPSPAGMSLTKLSLGGNYEGIYNLFLPRESLVCDITGISKSFFTVHGSNVEATIRSKDDRNTSVVFVFHNSSSQTVSGNNKIAAIWLKKVNIKIEACGELFSKSRRYETKSVLRYLTINISL